MLLFPLALVGKVLLAIVATPVVIVLAVIGLVSLFRH